MAVTLTTMKSLVGGIEDQYYAITYARLLMNGNESSTTDGFLVEPGTSGSLSYFNAAGERVVIDFTGNPEVVLRLNGLYINNVKVSGSDSKLYWLNDEGFQGGNVTALNLSAVNTLDRTWGNGTLGGIEISDAPVATSLFVAGVNDAPTTAPVVLAEIAEDSGARLITSLELLAAAEDVDGDELTVSNLQISSGGGQLVNNLDGTWSYTPAADDDTGVSFTYTISDGTVTVQGSATLDITPVSEGGENIPAVISGDVSKSEAETDAALTITGTLTSTDDDNVDNSFVAQTDVVGTRGTFSITEAGAWTFVANSAFNELNVGEQVQEIFNVTSIDGTPATVTVTITGTNDAAEISGTATGMVDEDSDIITASGTLTAEDVDNVDDAFQANTGTGTNSYGTFAVTAGGVWTYTLDNSNATVDALNDADSLTDTFTVLSADGTAQVVTVTITGTNDLPEISFAEGNDAGAVTEDTALSISGLLTASDVDTDAELTWSIAGEEEGVAIGTYGSLTQVNGAWLYTLNNAAENVQALAQGQSETDSFTVIVTDEHGAADSQTVTITITGTDDLPELTGDITGAVTEDINDDEGSLFATGRLTITDVDNDVAEYDFDEVVTASNGALGSLTIDAQGRWIYSVANELLQYLKQDQEKVETFTVTASGGFSQVITITITGTNDVPNITGSITGAVQEDTNIAFGTLLTTTGLLNITDADAGEAFFQTAVTPAIGVLGNLAITNQGAWSYSVSNSLVQDLNLNEARDEQFTVLSLDGTPTVITVTITGTNDVPVISFVAGNAAGAVTEDTTQTVSGVLTATDADTTAVLTWSILEGEGIYGSLVLDGNSGNWTYTLANGTNGADNAVQVLKQGEVKTETFTVRVMDENETFDTQTITITLTGTNDAPVIAAGGDTGSISEDAEVLTVTGTLTATDIDNGAVLTWSIEDAVSGIAAGTYGSLTHVDGDWTYTLNNAADNVQALNQGQQVTDSFTVIVTDEHGATYEKVVTVTITGTNDAPVIAEGGATGSISEDANELTVTGTLIASDVDSWAWPPTWSIQGEVSGVATGTYGSLTQVNGTWTYTLNNAGANVQALAEGQPVTDTFTVIVSDGLGGTDTQTVEVTITGTNDAPVINVITPVTLNEQSNTAALTSTINVTFTDIDLTDTGHSASIATASASGVTHPSLTEEALKTLISVGEVNKQSGSAEGSLSLNFSAASGVFDYLSVGEVVTLSYSVAVDDGDTGTDTQTFSITITGTNDNPVVLESSVVTRTVTERDDGAINENSGNLTVSGSINFADVDLSDILHGAEITVAPIGDEVLGTLFLNGGVDEAAVNQAADSIAWTYSVNAGQLDKLKAGETLTQEYVVRISDVHGGFVDQTVTITIVGTNDAPIVTLNSSSAVLTEDTSAVPVDSMLTLSASGTLSYSDVDLGITDGVSPAVADSHTIADSLQTAVWAGGESTTLSQPQFDALAEAFTTSINTVSKTGTWSFALANSAVQFLGEGETLTLTYSVAVTDSSGALNNTDSETVTITLAGTNDAPVIDVENSDLSVGLIEDSVADEDDLETQGVDESTHLVATGAVVFSDLDINDEHVVTLVLQQNGIVYSGADHESLENFDGSLDIQQALLEGITAGADSSGWNFAIANSAVQFLGAGETLTLTFDLSVTDNSGVLLSNVATETVTIVITGTNDAPVIEAETVLTASLTEDAVAADDVETPVNELTHLVATGDVVFSDLDITDGHEVALVLEGEGVGIVYSGGGLDTDALAAINGAITASAGLNSWNFAIANSAVQFLGAGETLTLTYALSVTDDSGAENNAATKTITITITGTNDQPSLLVGPADQSLTEDAAVVEGVLSAFGALTVTDADITDTHTIEFALASATVEGDALTVEALAAIDTAISTEAFDGEGLEWRVDILNSAVQFLAAGEELVLTFNVTAVDGSETDNATSAVQTITITVIGTNDGPTIVEGNTDASAAVTERLDGSDDENDGDLTDTGTISFADVDLSDSHTATVGLVVLDGEDHVIDTPLGELAVGAVNQETNSVDWTFTLAAGVIDGMAEGETLTQVYTVTIDDGQLGSVTQDITVTITGTNDAPTIVGIETNAAGSVTERADGAIDENDGNLTDTGVITFADVDLTDTHSASITATVATDGANNSVPARGTLTLGAVDQVTNTLTWTYTVAAGVLDNLGEGETLTQVYTVTIDDGNTGGTVTQDVTITLTGTNDAPTITAASAEIDNIEYENTILVQADMDGTVTAFSLGGNVVIGDVDASDVLTVKLSAIMGTLSGGVSELQLFGTVEDINTAIANLMFTPDSELGAGAALLVEVTDAFGATDAAFVEVAVKDWMSEEYITPLTAYVNFTAADENEQDLFLFGYQAETIVTIGGVGVSASKTTVEVDPSGTVISGEFTGSLTLLGYSADLDGNSILFADGSVLKTTSVKATLVGSAVEGGDYLKGSESNDVLRGMAGNDKLEGGGGNDTIYGGMGADIIYGGAGNDILYAGDTTANDNAADLFVYDLVGGYQGTDLIIGFANGQDKIGFDGASMANVVIAASVGSIAVVKLYADVQHTEELATIKLLGMAGNVGIEDFNFGSVPV
ncbi:VCBS domain-containing protein [Pseudomonas sp.]|uniref:VCBS domain-containing protein n=1 Tax=Pseudomonas sp. TaxID=306 RepID=UPI0027313FFF|nr:VCBS domain-containing protein [Pseudomonas sp.]MDP2244381.1 VCBS domain-containing protein [Pseudomonas sp.]